MYEIRVEKFCFTGRKRRRKRSRRVVMGSIGGVISYKLK